MTNEPWWISTDNFLPNTGERVLIISKFGHVSDAMWTDFGNLDSPVFSPDGFKPGSDVKWWMPIPTDGWHDIKEARPKIGEIALTMGRYGNIFNGTWKQLSYEREPMFHPFVWEVLFWRTMPKLPAGIKLK
ncbi:MAG: hypothetical protein IJ364_05405 [Oscillospiraceae bacterium]|nr:hypothetical protein [Oscillospiraceae bacterium]